MNRTLGMGFAVTGLNASRELDRGSLFRHIDIRRFMLPLAIMVAMVAVVVPTCRMIGCDMNGMGAMPFMPQGGAYSDCPGQWVVSANGANGIVPRGITASTFSLLLAILIAVAVPVFAPLGSRRAIVTYTGDPPPPLEDSFGARFRV